MDPTLAQFHKGSPITKFVVWLYSLETGQFEAKVDVYIREDLMDIYGGSTPKEQLMRLLRNTDRPWVYSLRYNTLVRVFQEYLPTDVATPTPGWFADLTEEFPDIENVFYEAGVHFLENDNYHFRLDKFDIAVELCVDGVPRRTPQSKYFTRNGCTFVVSELDLDWKNY
jgi:hypothetical protein